MTNKSMHLNKPFLLRPAGQEKLWGGSRLNDDFAKGIDLYPLGETWECSTHPMGLSVVASGEHDGMTLLETLRRYPQYVGSHPNMRSGLPILIKFIDAKMDLSVQVHPDDAYAERNENGQWGKTEMWYVLDATKDATLFYGFRENMDPETIRRSINDGTFMQYLQKIPVQKDDVFFVEAGTIHAIGAGVLIAEIQESSDLTYRLFDYDRIDGNGHKRELHVEKALQVLDLQARHNPRQPLRVLRYRRGWASELLCQCKYFRVERVLLNTERIREMVKLSTNSMSFAVLLCVDGCGTAFFGDHEIISFFRGDCIFIPADSVEIKVHGNAQLLRISC